MLPLVAGLFDTAVSESEVCNELARAMAMSEPGIHAILLVLTTSARFTAEEVACLNCLRSAYGGQLLRHCILVFTHGDNLEDEETPLHEFLSNCPESLQVMHVNAGPMLDATVIGEMIFQCHEHLHSRVKAYA